MKTIKIIVLVLAILMAFSVIAWADDLVWTMKPSDVSVITSMREQPYLDNFGLLIEDNNKAKLIDKNGNAIFDFDYSADYRPLSKDHLIVFRGYKYGVIDKNGKELIPCDKYDVLTRLNDSLLAAYICQDSSAYILEYDCGIIDVNGKVVVKFIYEDLSVINGEFISAKKDGKYGVINKSGKTVIPFKYDAHFEFVNENYLVSTPLEDKTPSVITDLKGKILLSDNKIKNVYSAFDGNFSVAYRNSESRYAIGEIKILNKNFKEVNTKGFTIEALNDSAYIAVNSDGKSAIVDKSFNNITDFVYDGLLKIDSNLILANIGGEYFHINAKGETLTAFSGYEFVSFLCDGYYRVGKKLENTFDDVYGIADKDGNLLVEMNYRNVKYIGKGVFLFETRSRRTGIATLGTGDKVNDYVDGLVLRIDQKEAKVFGKDAITDVTPIIRNGSTMLPVRFVAENLGAKVGWDGDKRQVTITPADPGAGVIVLTIDSKEAKFGRYGTYETLNMAPFIEQGRTYTPSDL